MDCVNQQTASDNAQRYGVVRTAAQEGGIGDVDHTDGKGAHSMDTREGARHYRVWQARTTESMQAAVDMALHGAPHGRVRRKGLLRKG